MTLPATHLIQGAFLGASAVVLAFGVGSSASADVSIEVENFVASGFEFTELTNEGEYLEGTLADAFGDFMLNQDAGTDTWCNDLTILIGNDTMTQFVAQIGGYSDTGALHYYIWPDGTSGASGTEGGGLVDLPDVDVTGYQLYIGNGYSYGGAGDWTGSISLNGSISIVPAGGTLAVLGLAGVTLRRRRV